MHTREPARRRVLCPAHGGAGVVTCRRRRATRLRCDPVEVIHRCECSVNVDREGELSVLKFCRAYRRGAYRRGDDFQTTRRTGDQVRREHRFLPPPTHCAPPMPSWHGEGSRGGVFSPLCSPPRPGRGIFCTFFVWHLFSAHTGLPCCALRPAAQARGRRAAPADGQLPLRAPRLLLPLPRPVPRLNLHVFQ